MGAVGLNKFLPEHTDVFSSAAWISGFSKNSRTSFDYSQISKLAEIPHWFLYEEEDFARRQATGAAQAINAAGGTAYTTEVPGVNHETFRIFQEGKQDTYGVINWLISNRKQTN